MRDKQREETRLRLYHAALEVFRRDGVHDCRIDDIAQLAEVSRAAFYFHFPTKDDVLLELLRESEAPVAKAVADLPPETGVEALLDTVATTMASFWKDDPRLILDLATVALRNTATSVNDREKNPARAVLTSRFAVCATRGDLSDILPSEALADFFLASSLAAMMAWTAQPQMPLEMMLKGVVQLFLRGAQGPALMRAAAPTHAAPAPAPASSPSRPKK